MAGIPPEVLGRAVDEVTAAYDGLLARMRDDRARDVLVEDYEVARRRGIVAAYSWLTGWSSVGPFTDGPASSRSRLEEELRAAQTILEHRGGPPAPRAAGVVQLLSYALGHTDAGLLPEEHGQRAA